MRKFQKLRILNLLIIPVLLICSSCQKDSITIRIATTTDVHGMIFPHDLVAREASDHSLSHLYTYANEQRQNQDTLFFLLDNGDFLQGQPTVYYYNFIDTASRHLSARVMNYMGYNAGTVGNHDIEAGPAVYNRLRSELDFPWLAANAVRKTTGEPYFDAYTILDAGGKKIAVLGLITPGIPHWLPQNLWPGMEFRDMVETAQAWIPRIIKEEKPDLVVGLFHSGTDASYGGSTESYLNENAVLLVAEQVPGFDVIFAGHDHRVSNQWVLTDHGDSVLVVDPGSHARFAGEVRITFKPDGTRILEARNVPMKNYEPSEDFLQEFSEDYKTVSAYMDDTIAWLTEDMKGLDAIFGPSSMMSLIHRVQLDLSGADLSFTAPLSLSATLKQGPVLVSDMFKLYRFENMLYSMELSGAEIKDFLEYSAGLWFKHMYGPRDHFLLFDPDHTGRLANPYYNFSSAAGINYTVDVSKPAGERVKILGFTNGAAFEASETYRVAINSYRGNGGGGHLTNGAGIPAEELARRISWSTDKDLRYHLMLYLSEMDTLQPETMSNWDILPGEWIEIARENDLTYFN